MKLLLHTCCAPCTIYPLKVLRGQGHDLTGYFYNPNIHPYLEYKKRLDTLKEFAAREAFPVIFDETYPMETFLREVVGNEEDRCRHCYELRLRFVAKEARAGNYDAFSTTLLYSIYQKHDLIRVAGEKAAAEYGVSFLYSDFREGWAEGVSVSREQGMYRQPYCGCIYSEKERYAKKLRKSGG
ncbi:MAG: epoxyqueuosine reductase QueH [Syntrophales bacterium]|nr:epoxyqueuosine reductase QueH [Syntrophales bacterium]